MGSGFSSSDSKFAVDSKSLSGDDHTRNSLPKRPNSSPATISVPARSSPHVTKRNKRLDMSTSKVAPHDDVVASAAINTKQHDDVTKWKEAASNAELKASEYKNQLDLLTLSISKLELTNPSLVDQLDMVRSQLTKKSSDSRFLERSEELLTPDSAGDAKYEGKEFMVSTQAERDKNEASNCVDDERMLLQFQTRQLSTLQQQLDEARIRIKKITSQYKRKVKQFTTQLAECKQEHSLEIFDYKTHINKLEDEIAMLSAEVSPLKGSHGKDMKTNNDSGDAAQLPDSRMALVLELSSKVSEQEAEIARLQDLLGEKGLQSGSSSSGVLEHRSSWLERCHIADHVDHSAHSGNEQNGIASSSWEQNNMRNRTGLKDSNSAAPLNGFDDDCDNFSGHITSTKSSSKVMVREDSECTNKLHQQEFGTSDEEIDPSNSCKIMMPRERRRNVLLQEQKLQLPPIPEDQLCNGKPQHGIIKETGTLSSDIGAF